MTGNRKAYETAYQRAVEGKSVRTFWEVLTSAFEDQYTRSSREKGARDGAAARAVATAASQGAVQG